MIATIDIKAWLKNRLRAARKFYQTLCKYLCPIRSPSSCSATPESKIYRMSIVLVLLYVCEFWFVILSDNSEFEKIR